MKSTKFSPLVSLMCGMASIGLLALGLTGCSNTAPTPDSTKPGGGPSSRGPSSGDVVSIGFIYVGPKDDYGYNQAHAVGAAAVKKMPGVKVTEEEKVPETVDVQKTMKSMIELDGAKLIFPTSFGYFDPHVLKMAAEYPKITFLHCRALSPATPRSPRGWASWQPSRFPRSAATSMPSPWGRAVLTRRSLVA